MVFTVNLIASALLIRWKLALSMIIVDLHSGVKYYQYFTGIDYVNTTTSSTPFILYSLLLSGTAIIILLKPKQEYIDAAEQKVHNLNYKISHYNERVTNQEKEIERLGITTQKMINNINHELRLPVGNVMNFAELLNKGLNSYTTEQLKTLLDEIYQNSNRLSTMILNMLDLATLNANKIELRKQAVNFSRLTRERIELCRRIYLQDKKINFKLSITKEIFLEIDPHYICQTIDNLIINSITFSKNGTISIALLQEDNYVQFIIVDQGKGIGKKEIFDIFTPFKMGKNNQSKAKGRGAGLALCKAAIEAHRGEINAKGNGRKGATFCFALPVSI